MPKKLKFKSKAWESLQKGIDAIVNSVKITLGSDGKYVVLERDWGSPVITNDGVTIARDIDLKDSYEELGAKLVKEVAHKTNEEAGDGTTTAIILAGELYNKGIKLVKKGVNRSKLRTGIVKATKEIVKTLKKIATPIKTKEQLEQIATLSASGDQEIGTLIAKAINKVGVDGAVLVETSPTGETKLEFIEGYKLKSGVISPFMIFNIAKQKSELVNPFILITDRALMTVSDFTQIADAFQTMLKEKGIEIRFGQTKDGRKIAQCDVPLVIFADSMSHAVLNGIVSNNAMGCLKWVGVKTPATLDKKEVLSDIALKTGGKLLTRDSGSGINSITTAHFGRCDKAIIDKNETILMGGKGDKKAVDSRIKDLKEAVNKRVAGGYNHDRLKTRLANLSNNVALLKIGAPTPTELTEKTYRVEDAINSAKAALEEGIVVGAGGALVYCSRKKGTLQNKEEQIGYDLLYSIIDSPAKQILENADMRTKATLFNWSNPLDKITNRHGYNTETRQLEDLCFSGIIDPVKVTRCALEYASSIIGTLLLSDVIIVKREERFDQQVFDMQGRPINAG